MRLTVLGASASFPAPGGACSGYLVEDGDTRVLLDCGSGVLSQLQVVARIGDLTAIVISHFHPDHYIDLIALRYGLRYGFEEPLRPRVLVPPGGRQFLRGLGAALRNAPEMFEASFALEEYDEEAVFTVGGLTLRFQRTTHDEPTWACALERGDGSARLVYTADTQGSDDLERFARGADFLLCEATYLDDGGALPSGNHLTAGQAGALARRAGVPRLMLTHFWPGLDLDRFAAEAAATFGELVLLARPGQPVEITPGQLPGFAAPRQPPVPLEV